MKQMAIIGLAAFSLLAQAVGAETPLDFKEVFEVIRTNLPGVTEPELNHAAARGLIAQLRSKVTLIAEQQSTNSALTNVAGVRTLVFDKFYGYVRPGQVTAGADKKFGEALAGLSKTNRLKGLVLDLRFSGGEDYGAAGAIADRFFEGEQPLIDYGDGLKKSTAKEDALKVPVAILVNGKTAGASEALSGILRNNEVGLLIGGANTAGQANIAKTITLSGGQSLRIATIPVKTGNGNPLPASGLKPDITVDVNPDEELGYVEELYSETPKVAQTPPAATNETAAAVTNRSRRRINEAELVRMLRDGQSPEGETQATRRVSAPAPGIQDPALARAVDLLKGLAVVQQTRTVGAELRN